jgi:ABC-type antimicrobial peptide transport system ATPase subunit
MNGVMNNAPTSAAHSSVIQMARRIRMKALLKSVPDFANDLDQKTQAERDTGNRQEDRGERIEDACGRAHQARYVKVKRSHTLTSSATPREMAP